MINLRGTCISQSKSEIGNKSVWIVAFIKYISDDNPNAAQRVKDDIETKVENLRDFPKMGRFGRVAGTRELIVWANYMIVYQEGIDAIKIQRVLHAAQQWPLSN